ncbi:MAG: hypothetical protein ACRC7N_17305 [Clostridium sp.]
MYCGQSLNITNIVFHNITGGSAERSEIIKKIKEDDTYLLQLVAQANIRDNISSFDKKSVVSEKTFHYKKGEDASKSINFFINTIDKYKDRFSEFLDYKSDYPLDIYFHRNIQAALGEASSYFVKVGFYDEFDSLGIDGHRGEQEYERVIIHEYIHAITFSMLYSVDEKYAQLDRFMNASSVESLYNSEAYNLPMWFIEGLGEFISLEIVGLPQYNGDFTFIDLKNGRPGKDYYQSNFYNSSAKIVSEIYKEIGVNGIISLINSSKNNNFYEILKVFTGKELEDYYYIFNGN